MASITYRDGQSMLPTSVRFGSPMEARGGTAKDDGGARQLARVAGALRKVLSELIALPPSLLQVCRNGSNWLFSLLLQM